MRKILCMVLILMFHSVSYSDWKREIVGYWDNYEDFGNMISYLENNIDGISPKEKSIALAILAFAYKNENNSAGEIKNIKELFQSFNFNSISPEFLSLSGRVKVFDFIERWKKIFPKIKNINIPENMSKLNFFSPPEFFYLNIESQASSEMKIIDPLGRELFSVFLKKGINLVKIPINIVELDKNITDIRLKTICGLISIVKNFKMEKMYIFPSGMKFNPRTGSLVFSDRDLKKERKKHVEVVANRYFDKKYLLRKSLLPIGVGVVLFGISRFIAKPKIESGSSPGSSQFFWSFEKTSETFALGLSIKGIWNFFRSFKKKKISRLVIENDEDSIRYNNFLKKILKKKRDSVFVKLKLIETGGEK